MYHMNCCVLGGIIANKASFSDKPGDKAHQRKPSDDMLFSGNLSLSAIQSTVEKMTIKAKTEPTSASQENLSCEHGKDNDDNLLRLLVGSFLIYGVWPHG